MSVYYLYNISRLLITLGCLNLAEVVFSFERRGLVYNFYLMLLTKSSLPNFCMQVYFKYNIVNMNNENAKTLFYIVILNSHTIYNFAKVHTDKGNMHKFS